MAQTEYEKQQTNGMVRSVLRHARAGAADAMNGVCHLPMECLSPCSWEEQTNSIILRLPLMLALNLEPSEVDH